MAATRRPMRGSSIILAMVLATLALVLLATALTSLLTAA